MQLTELYETPKLRVIPVRAEAGFAASALSLDQPDDPQQDDGYEAQGNENSAYTHEDWVW